MSVVLPQRPVTIPRFLVDYDNSFVYADDVANLIVDDLLTSSQDKRYQVRVYCYHGDVVGIILISLMYIRLMFTVQHLSR